MNSRFHYIHHHGCGSPLQISLSDLTGYIITFIYVYNYYFPNIYFFTVLFLGLTTKGPKKVLQDRDSFPFKGIFVQKSHPLGFNSTYGKCEHRKISINFFFTKWYKVAGPKRNTVIIRNCDISSKKSESCRIWNKEGHYVPVVSITLLAMVSQLFSLQSICVVIRQQLT